VRNVFFYLQLHLVWFGRPLAALSRTSGFVGDVVFTNNQPGGQTDVSSKWLTRGQHRTWG